MNPRRPPIDSLTVDGLRFAVRWSTRRRTVGITVRRDGELVIAAPARTSARRLEAVVREKSPWVRRKLAEFAALGPPPEPRQVVAGERFPYLGREYVLTLADGPPSPVALAGGSLAVDRALDGDARGAVLAWYEARATDYIGEAVARFAPLVGAAPAGVVVRDLGKRRWGVCDHRTRTVSFHWQLITQPPELVDYVVVHELAHLHEPNHGQAFWRHVADVLPDCKERRRRLTRRGDQVTF
ncbi:MAG: M48 family metallopeptidase [Deltaproteobacteria bacterium]